MLEPFDLLADLIDAAELLAREISERYEETPADDRRQAVGDDELEEVEPRGPRGDDHRPADAGEHAADAHDPDAPALEEHLGLDDPLLGHVFADERHACNFEPEFSAQGIE